MRPEGRCTVPLDQLAGPDGTIVAGGKLARLALLARAGLRVPDGFAVTAEAFRRHLTEPGPAAALPGLLTAVRDGRDGRDGPDGPDGRDRPDVRDVRDLLDVRDVRDTRDVWDARDHLTLGEASAELRRSLRETPVAQPLRAEITAACAALALRCGGPVAVRSSAVSEDGAEHSFAGMFESFLGVHGPDDVVAAVKDCWAGLFTHRSLAYRLHAGLPLDAPAMGVGVMAMVPARASGVAFSMHPVTGQRDRTVIEAAPGVGGAVTGGPVPERVEIARTGGRVLRHDPGTATAAGPLLSDQDLARVAEVVRHVEEVLGHPVDVEWAVDPRGRVWLLQARPVTGAPAPDDDERWDPAAFLLDL